MSDNRKYYYLKLKENYFDDDSIVLLESMQDGVLYSNILLKLYLKSLKHGGRLQLDEDIPYTAQMIATITRQQIGTVERALQIFLKLGLVEVLDSGTFYMSNIELLIGQSSTEAERKRAARLQNKALSALRTSGGHLSDIRPPEIEIELEKEIEIKREIEKGRSARAYGRYQNVFLTDEEMADLQTSFPTVWGQYIEKLSEYMASTGKRYKLIATIRSREISASIILQSQSQLKTIYKDAAETIIGNCDTMLFLGGKESSTLKEISETLGKETIDLYNTSDTRGQSPSFGTTYQKTGKELMSRDELSVMDGSKCILQLRGVRPFLSDKFDITKHKRYKELSDFDKKNAFDVERYLKHELRLRMDEEFDCYEVDVSEDSTA